jgi:hypothetical protein
VDVLIVGVHVDVTVAALLAAAETGTSITHRPIPPQATNRIHRTRIPIVAADRRDPRHIRQIRGTEDLEGQSPAAEVVKTSTSDTNIGMDLVVANHTGVPNEGVKVIGAQATKNRTRGAEIKFHH